MIPAAFDVTMRSHYRLDKVRPPAADRCCSPTVAFVAVSREGGQQPIADVQQRHTFCDAAKG